MGYHCDAMSTGILLYLGSALLLPAVWGTVVAVACRRLDRRRVAPPEQIPMDYRI